MGWFKRKSDKELDEEEPKSGKIRGDPLVELD